MICVDILPNLTNLQLIESTIDGDEKDREEPRKRFLKTDLKSRVLKPLYSSLNKNQVFRFWRGRHDLTK